MRTKLHIHKDFFSYNGVDEEDDVCRKLNEFATDMRDVIYSAREYDTIIVTPIDVLSYEIYKKKTLAEAIPMYLDYDQRGIFYSLMANPSETEEQSLDALKEMCRYKTNEQEIHSLLSLNATNQVRDDTKYIEFDAYEIVYNKSTWKTLRRQILGNHPGCPEDFVNNCRKLFENINFHDECVSSLIDDDYVYLGVIPRKLVYYLSCLNDCFYEHLCRYKNGRNENSVLADFSGRFGLDEVGSLQGNYKKKDKLYRIFKTGKDEEVRVLCEPHLKIARPDNNYRGKVVGENFHPRIYFHYERPEFPNKVLVGAMGEHIA